MSGRLAWLAPLRLWSRSLPFRVVVITLAASFAILTATGLFLLDQSTRGILAGKTQASVAEASAVVQTMQRDLNATDLRTTSVNEQVNRLARSAAERGFIGGQYYVVVETPLSLVTPSGVDPVSIPANIRTAVLSREGLLSTPTLITFTDGRQPEPGLVVAAKLRAPGQSTSYPVFFLFSTIQEGRTLGAVQQATWAAGALLLVGLALTVYLISMQVLRPVRAARLAAERLAAGHLEDRMAVVGTEDQAALARSMNHMASELDKKITQLENLSAVQQRFVSDISHELRTPLTTVRMAAEVIHAKKGQFDPPTARSAELLSAQLDRFEDLLIDLLEISRFDAGAAELTLEFADLATLVSEEIDAVAPLAAEFGTEITIDTVEAVVAEVDCRRIRRIVRNLLTNAIEHGEHKPIEVHLRSKGDSVAIAVRDHGVGLSPAEATRVFDRFWRADPARGRRVGGTGLGLPISSEDARLHGGTLEVWGSPGDGAQFRLTLPRRAGRPLRASPWPLVPPESEEVSHAVASQTAP